MFLEVGEGQFDDHCYEEAEEKTHNQDTHIDDESIDNIVVDVVSSSPKDLIYHY